MNISGTNSPLVYTFSEAETTLLYSIARPALATAKATGQIIKATHEKNKFFFNGCKVHSAALPNGSFLFFVKNSIPSMKILKGGASKDLDDCLYFELTPDGTIRNLPNAARLRFRNGNASEPDVTYHELLNGLPHIVRLIHQMVYKKLIGGESVQKTVLYLERHDMDLEEYTRSPLFKREQILSLLQQQLKALSHLHAKQLIHKDIQLSNFLIKVKENYVALTDFGTVTKMNNLQSKGDFKTWSPEQSLHADCVDTSAELNIQKKLDSKIDIWALGICLYQMIYGPKEYPIFVRYNWKALILYDSFHFYCPPPLTIENTNTNGNNDPFSKINLPLINKQILNLATLKKDLCQVSYALQPVLAKEEKSLLLAFESLQERLTAVHNEVARIMKECTVGRTDPAYHNIYQISNQAMNDLLTIGNEMVSRYMETIPNNAPQEDKLNYLLIKMLQPDAMMRIDAAEALQVIEASSKKRSLDNI